MYLGQLAGAHAAPLFLDAAAQVASRVPDASFLVVGGGRTLADTRAHAERLGLGNRVVFTGAVPHARVPDLLDVVDVAVATLPDTAQAATKSPLKVVEYMNIGLDGDRVWYTEFPEQRDGMWSPDRNRPGLGLALDPAAVEKYAV